MVFNEFGNLGGVLLDRDSLSFSNIRSGTLTASELILAGGTTSVIRSQNFTPDPLAGWAIYGDGTAYFGSNVQIGGDVYSGNWDGAIPANLASMDATATAGYYLDASVGSAQFMGDLFLGGTLEAGDVDTAGMRIDGSDGLISWHVGGSGADPDTFAYLEQAIDDQGGGIVGASLSLVGFGWTGEVTPAFLMISSSDVDLITPEFRFDFNSTTLVTIRGDQQDGSGAEILMETGSYLLMPGGIVRVGDGSVSTPTFTFNSDTNTGFYRIGADTFAAAVGGTAILAFQSDGSLRSQNGTNGAPAWSFISDPDTGIFRSGVNVFNIAAAGATAAAFTSAATSFQTGTTGSAANLHQSSSGSAINRSTSSLKYKKGWQYVDEDWLADLEIPNPITWMERRKEKDLENKRVIFQDIFLGFGTEHVHAMLPAATQDFNGDGLPENYDPRALIAILSAKVKRLERIVLNSGVS